MGWTHQGGCDRLRKVKRFGPRNATGRVWKLQRSAPIRVAYATPSKTASIAAPIAKARRKPLISSVSAAMAPAGNRPQNSFLAVRFPGMGVCSLWDHPSSPGCRDAQELEYLGTATCKSQRRLRTLRSAEPAPEVLSARNAPPDKLACFSAQRRENGSTPIANGRVRIQFVASPVGSDRRQGK